MIKSYFQRNPIWWPMHLAGAILTLAPWVIMGIELAK